MHESNCFTWLWTPRGITGVEDLPDLSDHTWGHSWLKVTNLLFHLKQPFHLTFNQTPHYSPKVWHFSFPSLSTYCSLCLECHLSTGRKSCPFFKTKSKATFMALDKSALNSCSFDSALLVPSYLITTYLPLHFWCGCLHSRHLRGGIIVNIILFPPQNLVKSCLFFTYSEWPNALRYSEK